MAKLSHKKNKYIYNMTSVYSNVLSPTEVRYLNDLPEVVSAKASLATRSSGTVRFSVTVTDTIRIALKAHFDLDVPSGSSIPMRWIKGDTEPHMDTGASKFANTYLVYLTSSPGSLIVDSQTYPIEANMGIVFNEGLTHATEGTGHSPRLLLGPMNEQAEPVGTPTTLQIPVNHLTLAGSSASNSTGSSSQSAVYTNANTLNDDGIYYLYPYGSAPPPSSGYTLSMPRRWFSIVQDGNGGEAGRAYGSMGQFISANTSVDANGRTSLTAIYIDQTHKAVRQLLGRSPDTNAQELFSLGVLSGLLNQLILNGSAVDIGSAAATVTNVGSVGFSEYAGLTGAQIVANNSDMYLQMPFTNNTAFTVSYWVYNSGGPGGWTQTMTIVGGDGNMGIAVYPDNAMYIFGFGGFSNELGAVSSNGWHQFTITYASGIFTLYVDNVQRGAFNHTYSLANEYICFGQTNFNAYLSSSQFNGNIRQVCIFDSVLSSGQMTALYNGTQGNEVLQEGIIRSFVGYSNLATSEYFTYYIVNDTLYSQSNASGASWPLPLANINTPATNVKLRKCCVGTTNLVFIAVGNGIYSVWYGSGLYTTLIVDDYSGHDYHVASEDGTSICMCYTTADHVKVVFFTNSGGSNNQETPVLVGNLRLDYMNPNCQPRVVVKNGTPSLFVIKNKMLCSTTIIPSNPIITVSLMIVHVKSYMPIATSSGIFIIGINHFNKLFEFAHSPPSPPKFIILDNRTVANNVFDVCTINNEQYIFYQDSNGFIRQLWNPINRINITFTAPITSITGSITGVTGSLYPAFDPAISDYGLQTEAQTSTVTYNLSIIQASGTTTISELAFPNQLLAISDANNTYYIRLHPSSTLYGTSNILSADYNPGYYLAADTYGSGSPYFSIYDSQGVPVWYRRVTSDPNFLSIGSLCAFQKGNGKNRAITLIFDYNRPRTVIDIATLEEGNYISLPPSGGGPPLGWEVHESLELDGPPNRRGNILHAQYVNGFYLQEQNTDHELVWDFYSTSAWPDTDPEWFHINAMSVHPVTGNIICSFRTNSTIACINYATKNVDWVIDPNNACHQYLIDPNLTTLLTIQGEPIILGEQYNGTHAQHDCRWHPEIAPLTAGNQVISIYDNQSFSGLTPRGVIYEIDLTNGLCIWRGNSYSEGSSEYMGSYRINYEANGTTSHVVDFVQQHPPLREYSGGTNGMPTQNTVFTMDFPGDWYRFDKATPNQMDIVAMRRTAGMPYSTPFDPTAPWTPVGSPNIRVWFDGNDIMADGTVFSDGAVNTGFNDKSGNTNNASGGTGNTYTTKTNIQNGLSVQRMTPANITGASCGFAACDSYTIFSAQRCLGPNPQNWGRLLNGISNGNLDDTLFYGTFNATTNLWAVTNLTAEGWVPVTPLVDLTNWCVLSSYFYNSTNQSYLNGLALDPLTPSQTVAQLTGVYIGSLYNDTQEWNGDIGDIIIYNGVLSTEDRQKVEGFLAWKWGLQSGLPSDHPYKYAAPTA
jgi:hypothetical protein